MQTWQQIYDPFGNLWLSALVAAIPIIFFFMALAVLRMKGHIAGTITGRGGERRSLVHADVDRWRGRRHGRCAADDGHAPPARLTRLVH